MALIEDLVDQKIAAALSEIPASRTRERRLATIDEAADLLALTPAAARKHAQRGNLPTVRIGRRLFIDLDRLQP